MSAFEILLPLALILTLTKLLGLGSQRIGLPAVIGMLIAGLLIGLLKLIPCEPLKNMFFSKEIEGWLKVFSKIGVVLIMFSTGLSTDLKQLKSSGAASVVITLFGVVVPMALGTLVAWAFHQGGGFLGYLFCGRSREPACGSNRTTVPKNRQQRASPNVILLFRNCLY